MASSSLERVRPRPSRRARSPVLEIARRRAGSVRGQDRSVRESIREGLGESFRRVRRRGGRLAVPPLTVEGDRRLSGLGGASVGFESRVGDPTVREVGITYGADVDERRCFRESSSDSNVPPRASGVSRRLPARSAPSVTSLRLRSRRPSSTPAPGPARSAPRGRLDEAVVQEDVDQERRRAVD